MSDFAVSSGMTWSEASRRAKPLVTRALELVARYPLGAFGLFVLGAFALAGVLAPWVAPYPYDQTNILRQLESPGWPHLLGTDNLGRDVLSRLIWGARVELLVGLGAIAIAATVAVVVGVPSGFYGGKVDLFVQRAVDVLQAFPGLVLLITIISMFQPGLYQVMVAIGIVLSPAAIRVVRAASLEISQRPYVESARAVGASDFRILVSYVLLNTFAPLMVTVTTLLGVAILLEASLSFLGYGVPPPQPSWGAMLGPDARRDMLRAPLLSVWPGLAIFLTVFSFNMLGDALRDALDPRLRNVRA
ncbi:Glutathione transport system permease protein GsiD [bacterium HR29]|jgi:peptide/nickel transport system permease protein|nr:Glutathione transport system permease protein GsiD [bacterium HR29]